jgi:glutamine synthetase
MGFDGSSITGYQDIEESDMIAMPDPDTFQIIPWSPQETRTARMICDIRTPDGDPYVGDPRYILKRALERAKEMGFDAFNCGPELEFFYFKDSSSPQPIDQGGYFDLTTLDAATSLRRETIFALQALGINVEVSHHEVAPSQHEIDLRFDDALAMADKVMTYKTVVKEIATRHGVYATFMPKPLANENGSGMHTHQSLFTGDKNAFFDADNEYYLSDDAPVTRLPSTSHGAARTAQPWYEYLVFTPARRRLPGWSSAARTRRRTSTFAWRRSFMPG